ncbi:hypothetical protein FJZ40_00660 [Candidatus Shapirobacteria bacterium]|nr:hypothetical protein [Candidatus Shapirobacteria bacterium]
MKRQISLLAKDEFEQRPAGRFLTWALSVGRWVVVFTEFIVIICFVSRFWFDRRISDLYDEIGQKKAILEATSDFERDFRFTQKRLEFANSLISQLPPDQIVNLMGGLLPGDVFLTSLGLDGQDLKIEATALSRTGLASFLAGLRNNQRITAVAVSSISKEEEKIGIQVRVSATLKQGDANAI